MSVPDEVNELMTYSFVNDRLFIYQEFTAQ
jgi:hypothetical protein